VQAGDLQHSTEPFSRGQALRGILGDGTD